MKIKNELNYLSYRNLIVLKDSDCNLLADIQSEKNIKSSKIIPHLSRNFIYFYLYLG